jgi:hypothetical protein
MQYLLLAHCKNGWTNAPDCYITRKLPALFYNCYYTKSTDMDVPCSVTFSNVRYCKSICAVECLSNKSLGRTMLCNKQEQCIGACRNFPTTLCNVSEHLTNFAVV